MLYKPQRRSVMLRIDEVTLKKIERFAIRERKTAQEIIREILEDFFKFDKEGSTYANKREETNIQ